MDNTENKVHKRRVRYSGTHPKHFHEKYKELNPEKYGDEVEKIKTKGHTPAGMHISIMVDEILDFLDIKPGQVGLDATLGYGGHTAAMLRKLEGNGHLYALDIDPIEIEKTKARLAAMGFGDDILTVKHTNFANLQQVSDEVGKFDFILADLGVSSMQIDNPERGFTFKHDGPLDLRLNPQAGVSAAQRLLEITQEEFEGMMIENSDEPYADKIAKSVFRKLNDGHPVETTRQLYDTIREALSFLPKKELDEAAKKSAQRVFQALRIDVNSEFEVLYAFLEALPNVLKPGGRVCVLTFHSGEDRLVKKSFKSLLRAGEYSDISEDVIRPSAEECNRNSRARSTKMRWAVK